MKNTLSISWKLKYMELAKTIASWSKDPSTQVGAICVGEIGQVLSQGYNGFPRGVLDLPEKLQDRTEKYKHTVHAEMNCIYHACRTGVSLKGSSMFVYGLPICHECAKAIIQVGIRKVYFNQQSEKENWKVSCNFSLELFKQCGVEYETI